MCIRDSLDATNRRHKIRLAGIDAPELAQDFGQKARTNLSALAFNRQAVADCREFDRYPVSYTHLDVYKRQYLACCMVWAAARSDLDFA